MGLWDVLRGPLGDRARPTSTRCSRCRRAALTLEARWGCTPTGVGVGLLPGRRGAAAVATQQEAAGPGRRRRRPGDREPRRRVRLHLADRRAPSRPTSRRWSPTCTPSTPRWRTRASAPGCCARWSDFATTTGAGSFWSTSTSRAPSIRSARPARAAVTRCWSARSATPSAEDLPIEQDTSRWMPIWGIAGTDAGSRARTGRSERYGSCRGRRGRDARGRDPTRCELLGRAELPDAARSALVSAGRAA